MSETYYGHSTKRTKALAVKIVLWTLVALAIVAATKYVTFRVTPWPSTLLIRRAFQKDAIRVSLALEVHVPSGVSARLNEHYDAKDDNAYLDQSHVKAGDNSHSEAISELPLTWFAERSAHPISIDSPRPALLDEESARGTFALTCSNAAHLFRSCGT